MKNNRLLLILVFLLLAGFSFAEANKETNAKTNAMEERTSLGGIMWLDVHGAGSQRSDPKSGDPALYSEGHGPQGDAIRIYNRGRAVRTVSVEDLTYPIVDTNQSTRYNNKGIENDPSLFVGQDADYSGNQKFYTDNLNGTITDNVTGLMWQKDPGSKITWSQAQEKALESETGGYNDWRVPTIKELYSLIQFSGRDISPQATSADSPFIDTEYFNFSYGDLSVERIIDAQYLSSTKYESTTMHGDETVFGVNFADGRIKGYGLKSPGGKEKTFFVLLVRGNKDYGRNNFIDNQDGTITDLSTGLMWSKEDSNEMVWEDSLIWAENLEIAGYSDWRLPDIKELQSIVDYSRCPEVTNSPAINPAFICSEIINEANKTDYSYYWSSTTHVTSAKEGFAAAAAYIAFGRSLGNMSNLEPLVQNNTKKNPPPRKKMN